MPQPMNQRQLFYVEQKKLAETNALFLELVADGLTREDLEAGIARRPSLWQRFESWLPKLPSRAELQAA